MVKEASDQVSTETILNGFKKALDPDPSESEDFETHSEVDEIDFANQCMHFDDSCEGTEPGPSSLGLALKQASSSSETDSSGGEAGGGGGGESSEAEGGEGGESSEAESGEGGESSEPESSASFVSSPDNDDLLYALP